jgi:hypothetical protein
MTPGPLSPPPAPTPRRPAGKWILLLLAWAVGLAVWSLYLGLIIVFLFRWLA